MMREPLLLTIKVIKRITQIGLVLFRLRLPMEIGAQTDAACSFLGKLSNVGRELEEPIDETRIRNGLKATTDEMRQLTTCDGLAIRKSGCAVRID